MRPACVARWVSVLAVVAAAEVSTAQPDQAPTPGEKLFREGRDAMANNDYATACDKFAKSYELEHVPTPLLNEADCEEKRGHLVVAIKLWKQGRTQATDKKVVAVAEQHIGALTLRVPTLEVHVAAQGATGVEVMLDGAPFVIDQPTPVEPGAHTLTAKATGYAVESHGVSLAEGAAIVTKVLDGAPPATPTPPPTPSSRGQAMKTAGIVFTSVGVAGALVFAGTGIADLVSPGSACKQFTCAAAQRPHALLAVNAGAVAVGGVGIAVGIPLVAVGAHETSHADAGHASTNAAPKASLEFAPTWGGGNAALVLAF